MSWDSEERIQHLKDMDRIMRCEIDPYTKEEHKFSTMKEIMATPRPDPSTYRNFTRVILREEWGAIPAIEQLPALVLPVNKIHYSYHRNWPTCYTTKECTQTVRMMQLREINERGLPDVRHNFMIGNDCNVYEGRGMNHRAEQPYDMYQKDWDERSLDIGFFGEIDDNPAFEEMYHIAEQLIASLKIDNYVTNDYKLV